jgi:protein phosphatase
MMNKELVKASLSTDRGCLRDHNEDFVASHEPEGPEEESRDGWLYIVADGVGGSDFGEVASQYATEQTIYHYLATYDIADWRQRLVQAIEAANADLRLLIAERGSGNRMATTMVAVAVHDQWATIANVGDSRGYRWRDGQLEQITKDHSLVARLVEEGAITPEEALNHPRKNVILRSLGSENRTKIDVFDVNVAPGECLVLCSDGLTRHVADQEIGTMVDASDPDKSTEALISLAKERGGEDNLSVVILSFQDRPTSVEIVSDDQPRIMTDGLMTGSDRPGNRALWTYTAILCLVQTLLIIGTWIIVNS